MRAAKTRDIAAALLKKGFKERSSHHKIFYLCIDGKTSGVHTFLSHGMKEYKFGPARKDEDPTTSVWKRIRRSYPLPVIG